MVRAVPITDQTFLQKSRLTAPLSRSYTDQRSLTRSSVDQRHLENPAKDWIPV